MADFVADLLALMLQAPCTLALLLLSAFVGWTFAAQTGALLGAVSGVGLGAWLDISSSRFASAARWPIAITALLTLAVIVLR